MTPVQGEVEQPNQMANEDIVSPTLRDLDASRRPQAKNRLRAMSELGMVRIAGGSEVLLQGNVSDQLEHKTAERADPLRRDMAGAGGITTC